MFFEIYTNYINNIYIYMIITDEKQKLSDQKLKYRPKKIKKSELKRNIYTNRRQNE